MNHSFQPRRDQANEWGQPIYSRDTSPETRSRREKPPAVPATELLDNLRRSRNAILPKQLTIPTLQQQVEVEDKLIDLRLYKFELSKSNVGGNNKGSIDLFQRIRPNYVRQPDNDKGAYQEVVTGNSYPFPKHRTYRYVGNTLEELLIPGSPKLSDQDKFLGFLYKFLSLSEICVLHRLVPRTEKVIQKVHQPFEDPFSLFRCYDVD